MLSDPAPSSSSSFFGKLKLIRALPFVTAQQLAVKLLVTLRSFDWIHQLLGFDEVRVLVPLQVIRPGYEDGNRGRLPMDAFGAVLLQAGIC